MSADALSDVLKTVRLTGAAFFEILARDTWAVGSPARDIVLPKILPGADRLIAYHVVASGRCFATAVSGKPMTLEAGEVVVFTGGQPHIMSSDPGMHADPTTADVVEIAATGKMPFNINCGGEGPASTRLICGYLACDAQPFNPVLDHLPPIIKAGDSRQSETSWVGQFIKFALAESAQKRVGGETVLTKLSELMFIDVLRRHIETLPPEQNGWLAGLRDPLVGKVLSLMHARPAHAWTIETLGREAGLSRSVLAERFTNLIGIPPMQYLSKWRMQLATELLRGGILNMAQIATQIGYESEAAFSRAFKKMIGVSPSVWRLHGARAARTQA
jgi:AraC-like DNA-binding protein